MNAEDTLELFGDVRLHRCDVCAEETTKRCKEEHPEWFTKKLQDRKTRYWHTINQYIEDNTPKRQCIVVTDMCDESCETYDRCAVCGEHLQMLAQYLQELRHAESQT